MVGMVLGSLDEVVAYARGKLRTVASTEGPLPLDPTAPILLATEIGDGNLNFAWRVREDKEDTRSVFIKQAPGYIKCLGDGYALGAERMHVESDVMQAYMVAAPAFVPKLLVRDEGNFAMITEARVAKLATAPTSAPKPSPSPDLRPLPP